MVKFKLLVIIKNKKYLHINQILTIKITYSTRCYNKMASSLKNKSE